MSGEAFANVVPFPAPTAHTHVAQVEGAFTVCRPILGPRCERCGGSGWFEANGRAGRCRSCQRPRDCCEHWNRAGVPASQVAAGVEAFAWGWDVQDLPRSAVVRGENGRGKSFQAAAALRWLCFEAGLRPLWIEHLDLVGRVRRSAIAGRPTARGQVEDLPLVDRNNVGTYAKAEALVVDDARSFPRASLEHELLEELLCRRWDAGLCTIVTTNEKLEFFGPRLESRLRSWDQHIVTGIDRRDPRQRGRA